MNAESIKKKREERSSKLTIINEQIENLENDNMYSESHKSEQIRLLVDEKFKVAAEYDNDIKELVKQAKEKYLKWIDEEQFKGDTSKQLLIEIKNQKLADELYHEHKSSDGSGLLEEAKRAVELNLSHAAAYVNTLKRLDNNEAYQLEKELEQNSRTPLQKEYYKELEKVEREENIYKFVDVVMESDPLRAAIAEKTYGV